MIQAILFDFDGLILDTETAIFEAWKHLYQEFGCELDPVAYSGCVGSGRHLFDPERDLETKAGKRLDWQKLRPGVTAHYRRLIGEADALPGVRDCVRRADELGLRLAIASSSNYRWVHEHLTRLGLFNAFDVIRTRDDVARIKPEPDLFQAALAGLNLPPPAAFVLEDSPNGAIAAERAGIFCVAVPNETTRQLPFPDSAWKIDSLAHKTLDQLIDGVRERTASKA